ncbi:lysosomal alpha-mannosidase II isoform X1 [Halictus rubicundus]|uniref:lysosomal alpha-mannosidase II isoform X1 n=1 Tax=Halictus rubicundus TaxID=77578 RepID=UPI004036459A
MLWLELLLPFLLVCSYGGAASLPRETGDRRCGYKACPAADKTKLNIHLVPHTHDDVGWLKTVDQYFFGSRSNTQLAGVQYILDSVVQALLANPERRFMYVETAFLWKWWVRQNERTKGIVRDLINQGQLEIIGGGWSMNDEAVTHYQSLVDQYTWGFRRLYDEFGTCAKPSIGWQIDPFGHSREQASIFSQLGFDGLFLGRIDYQDKQQRLENKSMEFIWKSSPSLGAKADLFTVAMYNTYSPPPGFCFDVLCRDEPINDDPRSPDYNVPERVNKFLEYARKQASQYRTNNIILTMGEDFNYQQAEMWYTNLDRLIRYVRELRGTEVNIFYSTPSCYLKAVHDANLEWPTKDDDFFPYASDAHSYWTGYFTSRPSVKYFERMGNNLLQVTKQLSVLSNFTGHDENLERFREAMGIMQHHDAVTGTEKQAVASDYARILYESMVTGSETVAEAVRNWMAENQNRTKPAIKMFSCMQLNISSCPYTEDQNSMLTIYNPLTFEINTPIRVPVKKAVYKVSDPTDSSSVTSQLVPIANSVQQIPQRESKATHELVFMAKVPALGYRSYKVEKISENYYPDSPSSDPISNKLFEIYIDENGKVVVNWKKEKHMNLVQSFHYYEGKTGNNKVAQNRSSGAYIFRPNGVDSKAFVKSTEYKVYKGDVVQEIHQTINEWVSQVIRIYNEEQYVEFDWLVGPIPVKDNVGKEIVTKYSSNLQSKGEFYTDSNGREMLKRQRSYRPSWNLKLEEPVAGNYYPVTSKIALEDKSRYQRLSVITDRAQGGTSMRDGEIELMVHRRLLHDDAFGVGEALNEEAFGTGLVVRGSHYLYGGSTKNLDSFMLAEKTLQLETVLRPWTLVTPFPYGSTIDELPFKTPVTAINNSLRPNVHLLTLEPWAMNIVILRLEHIFEKGESETYSKPVEINLQGLLANYNILTCRETTLGANEWVENVKRMQWRAKSNEIVEKLKNDTPNPIDYFVTLNPMEIKTFLITLEPRRE